MELRARVTGQLVASFSCREAGGHEHVFRELAIQGAGPVQIAVRWFRHGQESDLFVNGVPVQACVDESPFVVTLPGELPIPRGRIYSRLRAHEIRDNAERHFIQTIIGLDDLVARGDEYSLITASARLRLLLIDGQPLVHRVNRIHRRTLQFDVLDWPPLSPAASVEWRPLDPAFLSQFSGAVTRTLGLGQLLSHPLLSFDGQTASVRDVIKACANAKGGVHFGAPGTAAEAVALAWDETIRIMGPLPSLQIISEICCVVLRGLGPLVNAMQHAAGVVH